MIEYIRKNLLEYVDVDEDDITPETHFVRDLHMNSYDFISIIGKVESELGIEIPDIEIRNIETVGDMDNYLKKKLG